MPAATTASREEFNLFNPALIALAIEEAVRSHRERSSDGMIVPLVYATATIGMFGHFRAELPSTTKTHFATWIKNHPEFRPEFQRLLKGGLPALRAGLLFGLGYDTLVLDASIVATTGKRRQLPDSLSDETIEILAASRFVGRWFGKTGSPSTILSLLGFAA